MDLIFFGGHIITMHEEDPLNEAVAIHNGKISSIGKKDEIMKLRTWKTKVIDLRGKTLMPGFIEAHCHPIATAILSQVVDISGFNYNSRSEILNTIRVAVKKASPEEAAAARDKPRGSLYTGPGGIWDSLKALSVI